MTFILSHYLGESYFYTSVCISDIFPEDGRSPEILEPYTNPIPSICKNRNCIYLV